MLKSLIDSQVPFRNKIKLTLQGYFLCDSTDFVVLHAIWRIFTDIDLAEDGVLPRCLLSALNLLP